MDIRKSPRLAKSLSTASSSSTQSEKSPSTDSSSSTGRGEREVKNPNNHSRKHIRNLFSASFTAPKLKSDASSILPKRPIGKLKPAQASTDTTVEKSQVVEEEPGTSTKKKNARVWCEKDEIDLLLAATDFVNENPGENPESLPFCESVYNSFSSYVTVKQIKRKVKYCRERYQGAERKEKEGEVLEFDSLHHQKCHELSKPIWGSEDGGGGGEGVIEIRKSGRVKKRKANSSEREDGAANAATVMEEPEENNVEGAENQKGEEGENRDKNKKKKNRRAGASVPVSEKLKAPADNQEHVEIERNNNKKKRKTKVGNAGSVSENLIERWTKALSGSGSPLSEENKKAIRLIEPSKIAALLEKLEKLQLQKMEMLLKEALLVQEFVLMVSEAERSPTF